MVDAEHVLRPCMHQVAGHMFEEGKVGSYVDDLGHFYKPLQRGPRGDRERMFYEAIASDLAAEHIWRRNSTLRSRHLQSPVGLEDGVVPVSPQNITQRDELGLVPGGLSPPRTSSRDAGVVANAPRTPRRSPSGAGHGPDVDSAAAVTALALDALDLQSPRHVGGLYSPRHAATKMARCSPFESVGSPTPPDVAALDKVPGQSPTAVAGTMEGRVADDSAEEHAINSTSKGHAHDDSAKAHAVNGTVPNLTSRKLPSLRVKGTPVDDVDSAKLSRRQSSSSSSLTTSSSSCSSSDDDDDDKSETQAGNKPEAVPRHRARPPLPFSIIHAPLLRVIPRFYGVVSVGQRQLLELEDLAGGYRRPCIVDIKVGYRTWYPEAGDEAYIARCKVKDSATTQARLGFKVCGMQVWRVCQGGYWRASKRWCKTLPEALVNKALISFTTNENGLKPRDVYGGPNGAVAQLRSLLEWVDKQRAFCFYSSSILLLYEGDATDAASAKVRVRLVDFAHSFRPDSPRRDDNFYGGLTSLAQRLQHVQAADLPDSIGC